MPENRQTREADERRENAMALERLDKILSSTGRWSRKEIKDMVRHGRVRADGMTVAKPEDKFDPAAAHIQVDGQRFPVGRLDKDTTGLLLLTDDGPLGHELLSPKKHVDKVYLAQVEGKVDQSDVAALAGGMVLGDGLHCLPAGLKILGDGSSCLVTLREGKYHQVKRMLAARGKPVTALHRLSMGPLKLEEELKPGQWRTLTENEIAALRGEL